MHHRGAPVTVAASVTDDLPSKVGNAEIIQTGSRVVAGPGSEATDLKARLAAMRFQNVGVWHPFWRDEARRWPGGRRPTR